MADISLAATKRLQQFALLPAQKRKKYQEAYALYVKAARSYSEHSQALPAAESYMNAAALAVRKLHDTTAAVHSFIEAALIYIQHAQYELAYDAIKKAIAQRTIMAAAASSAAVIEAKHSPPQPTTAPVVSPASIPIVSLAVHASSQPVITHSNGHVDTAVSRGAGLRLPPSDARSQSLSVPSSPTDPSPKNTPSTPQPGQTNKRERRKSWVGKMTRLITGRGSSKDDQQTNGVRLQLPPHVSASPKTAPLSKPLSPNASAEIDHRTPPPLTLPAKAQQPPASPSPVSSPSQVRGSRGSLTIISPPVLHLIQGQIHTLNLAVKENELQLTLRLGEMCVNISNALWNDLHYTQSNEAMETALEHFDILDQINLHSYVPPQMYSQMCSLRLLMSHLLAERYIRYHSDKFGDECGVDRTVVTRARDLFDWVARRLLKDEVNRTKRAVRIKKASMKPVTPELLVGEYEQKHAILCDSEYVGLPTLLADIVLAYVSPLVVSCIFASTMCDAIVMTATQSFPPRVLNVPPLLHVFINLHPPFLQTYHCRYVRQCYGLLQLSCSAPARLVDGGGEGPEDQYRRVMLTIWGGEIVNEFTFLTQNFMIDLSPVTAVSQQRPLANTPISSHRHSLSNAETMKSLATPTLTNQPLASRAASFVSATTSGTPNAYGLSECEILLMALIRRLIIHNTTRPGHKISSAPSGS